MQLRDKPIQTRPHSQAERIAIVHQQLHSIEMLSQGKPGDILIDRRDGEQVRIIAVMVQGALRVRALDGLRDVYTVLVSDFCNWDYQSQ